MAVVDIVFSAVLGEEWEVAQGWIPASPAVVEVREASYVRSICCKTSSILDRVRDFRNEGLCTNLSRDIRNGFRHAVWQTGTGKNVAAIVSSYQLIHIAERIKSWRVRSHLSRANSSTKN